MTEIVEGQMDIWDVLAEIEREEEEDDDALAA